MIELRRLAITDLSQSFARQMGDNKIRHYRVTAHGLVMSKFTGLTAEDLVKEHIKTVEGNTEEVIVLSPRLGTAFFHSTNNDPDVLQVKDVSHIVLKNRTDIEFSLAQRKMDSVLHQYNEDPTPLRSKFLSPITTFINKGLCKINGLLRDFQLKDLDLERLDRFEYLNLKYFQIPLLPMYGMIRKISPCSYIAVGFEEDDIQEAVETFLQDLKILNDRDLIMGHLCMPSMILLADIVGSGKVSCVLFCFLFVDQTKLMKECGVDSYQDLPRKPLTLVGVKNEVEEGGINYLNGKEPGYKYEIEVVNVTIGTPEGARQAHIDNYNDTIGLVNEVAKKAKEKIEETKVLNKDSVTTSQGMGGTSTVAVTADLIDKNGKVTSLGELYRKNEDK